MHKSARPVRRKGCGDLRSEERQAPCPYSTRIARPRWPAAVSVLRRPLREGRHSRNDESGVCEVDRRVPRRHVDHSPPGPTHPPLPHPTVRRRILSIPGKPKTSYDTELTSSTCRCVVGRDSLGLRWSTFGLAKWPTFRLTNTRRPHSCSVKRKFTIEGGQNRCSAKDFWDFGTIDSGYFYNPTPRASRILL